MRALRAAVLAVWSFVVGDDWLTAAGAVLALGLTAAVAALGATAWYVMVLAVPIVLWRSLRRAAPARPPRPPTGET